MDCVFYGNKTIQEIDEYYRKPQFLDDCLRFQKLFKEKGINLTLLECENIYAIYSDEHYCAGWECADYLDDEFMFSRLIFALKESFNDKIQRMLKVGEEIEKYYSECVEISTTDL